MSRLPTVSGDGNAWGTILNDFLSVSHNADGSIKNLFYNVKDPAYGAVGNGTTDDTAAIQAAINAATANGAGIVYFPDPVGSYLISASLIVDNDSVALIGFCNRGIPANPTILVAASADPTWAIIVGNTKYISNNLIQGISIQGRNTTSSTGGGILFRSNGGKISQTKIEQFGGTGLQLSSFSGTVFETLLEDVDLVQNGMNTTTPGDNLVVASTVSDCEYHRVISAGDAAKTMTRHGINNSANQQKFVDCHAYFCSGDGFHNTAGGGVQILGGEWETNTANGINMTAGNNHIVLGAACFVNGNYDIVLQNSIGSVVEATVCSSSANHNIGAFVSSDCVISDCICKGPSVNEAIAVDASSSKINIHDCVVNGTIGISTGSTNSDIHDNIIEAGGITEITGANTNNIHDNTIVAGGITIIGAATRVKNNRGYNPVGHIASPSIPASTVAYTNTLGVDCMVFIVGGTVTVIAIGGTTTGATSGWFRVPVGQTITMTYSVVPTSWTWFGD